MDKKPFDVQKIIMDDSTVKPKVLCVEDELFIGDLYTRALTKAGYDVVVISDGKLALEEAEKNTFDIILLDIMLPSLSGVEILHTLRNPDRTTLINAKIIITTNLDQEEENREKIESMADGYIIKAEITPRELVTYLSQIKL